ncbi:type I secretion system permease/ATPase [Maritalea sp.]|uniref:type I secretion system permease/ATPase n=1 Tax=Maritalea sp. TaxID=2003361 RepID=UPI003EF8B923
MTNNNSNNKPGRPKLAQALSQNKSAFIGVGMISAVVNILTLTGSIFMLQVYDRVIPSGSVPTLIGLCVIAAMLFAFQGIFDNMRLRILGRIGRSIDEHLGTAIYRLAASTHLGGKPVDGGQAQQDLDRVRGFMASMGPIALFDAPWLPFYLAICFVFHPLIGIVATAGGLILCAIAIASEVLSKDPVQQSAQSSASRNVYAREAQQNAEALKVMGMAQPLSKHWDIENQRFLTSQAGLNDVVGGLGNLSKILRMMLQSGVLAVGAWLVIHQEATGGIMIASSIMMGRALAPIELAVSNWKNFMGARQGWGRLSAMLNKLPDIDQSRTELPIPNSTLTIEHVTAAPPGGDKPTLANVSFSLLAGQGLGIIGPSGSGKSTLAKVMVGAWDVQSGSVRLDGGSLDQWDPHALGVHIGYLPQTVDLLSGTIAQNIARFEEDASSEDIIKAAKLADIHSLVLQLPDGYETQIGHGGTQLSSGQKQRVALARALYRDPFFVLLDEPNSNLDGEGEIALNQAISSVRQRGGIVVVIAHRPSILGHLDQALILKSGRIEQMGTIGEVLGGIARNKLGPTGHEINQTPPQTRPKP